MAEQTAPDTSELLQLPLVAELLRKPPTEARQMMDSANDVLNALRELIEKRAEEAAQAEDDRRREGLAELVDWMTDGQGPSEDAVQAALRELEE
jgi:hypothetical protein